MGSAFPGAQEKASEAGAYSAEWGGGCSDNTGDCTTVQKQNQGLVSTTCLPLGTSPDNMGRSLPAPGCVSVSVRRILGGKLKRSGGEDSLSKPPLTSL